MKILNEILEAISEALGEYFVGNNGIMSRELQKILSHPEDRKIYLDAIHRLHEGKSKSETISLSTGQITISNS